MLDHASTHQNPLLDFLLEPAPDTDDFLAEVARFLFVGRGCVCSTGIGTGTGVDVSIRV